MQADITLLDGGLGQELIKRSNAERPHPLWSMQVMIDEPDLVAEVHRDFCLAGAKVLCLNTYSCTRHRLTQYADPSRLEEFLNLAYELACQGIAAAEIDRNDIDVVASLPPLTASYVAKSPLTREQMVTEYCELIELQKARVDGFIAETLSSIEEVDAVLEAAAQTGVRLLLGVTVLDSDGSKLRSGEPLESAVTRANDSNVDAVLANCSIPEAIEQAIPILAKSTHSFGAYCNGFTSIEALKPGMTVDVLESRKDLGPIEHAGWVSRWLDAGASVVGGCCEVGPDHIATLYALIGERGQHVARMSSH